MLDILDTRLKATALPTRVRNALQNNGCNTLRDVTRLYECDLERAPNFGNNSMLQLKEFLMAHGLSLRGDTGPDLVAALRCLTNDLQAARQAYNRCVQDLRAIMATEDLTLPILTDILKRGF